MNRAGEQYLAQNAADRPHPGPHPFNMEDHVDHDEDHDYHIKQEEIDDNTTSIID